MSHELWGSPWWLDSLEKCLHKGSRATRRVALLTHPQIAVDTLKDREIICLRHISIGRCGDRMGLRSARRHEDFSMEDQERCLITVLRISNVACGKCLPDSPA